MEIFRFIEGAGIIMPISHDQARLPKHYTFLLRISTDLTKYLRLLIRDTSKINLEFHYEMGIGLPTTSTEPKPKISLHLRISST